MEGVSSIEGFEKKGGFAGTRYSEGSQRRVVSVFDWVFQHFSSLCGIKHIKKAISKSHTRYVKSDT